MIDINKDKQDIGIFDEVEQNKQLRSSIERLKQKNILMKAEIKRLSDIVQATEIGTWEWHVPSGDVIFNEKWAEMLGYTLLELLPTTINTWIENTHPDDYKKSLEALALVEKKQIPYYEIEIRVKHKKGHWIWVLDKGEVISWDKEGKPLMIVGSHTKHY